MEVRVIVPHRRILHPNSHRITLHPAPPKIVLLEVERRLCETIPIQDIVDGVHNIEAVNPVGIDILIGCGLFRVWVRVVVEFEIGAGLVGDVVELAFVCDHVVAAEVEF